MPELHLTINGFDASVEVSDEQYGAVHVRANLALNGFIAELMDLGMRVQIEQTFLGKVNDAPTA